MQWQWQWEEDEDGIPNSKEPKWNGMEERREGGKEPPLQGCWLAAWAGKISREEWMAWGGA